MTTETDAPEGVAEDILLDDDQPEGQDTQPADDAGADTVEGGEGNDAPKPAKQTAQDRIDELTRDKHAERRRAEAAERELEALRPKAEPAAQPAADDEPDPSDAKYQFGETDPAYIKDLGAHAARQEFIRLRNEDQQSNVARSVRQADADRRAEFAKAHPDFDEKVFKSNWARTDIMADEIEASEHGPAVAYHLATNPAEAERIAKLDARAQIRAIGAIEGKLSAAAPTASTTPVNTVSNAPPPAPNLRGKGGQFKAAADTDDFAAFEASHVKN
jgi:hypothetical protein